MHFIECFRCMLKRRLIGKQEGVMKQNGGMGRQLALGKWYRTTKRKHTTLTIATSTKRSSRKGKRNWQPRRRGMREEECGTARVVAQDSHTAAQAEGPAPPQCVLCAMREID